MLKCGYLKYGVMAITSVVMLCGCSENGNDEWHNEPMSFTAAISSRTQTRATVDSGRATGSNLIVRSTEPAKETTESIGKMTRVSTTPDGTWPSGAKVALQVSGNSNTAQYTVKSDGTITSVSPLYWTSNNNITVTSWYPYSASRPSSWSVNSDQSASDASNYNSSDFLYSSNTFSYGGGSSNKLTYSHETAKVVINIVKANDISSSSNISSVTIGTSGSLIGLSGTVGSDGTITGTTTTTGYIIPYQTTSSTYAATYSAMVIPQDMNGKQFIAIKVTGGNIFYYIPSSSTVLSGGHTYTYNVTVPSSTTTVGSYYFSDGSWGALAVHCTSTVWPIGVIFSNSPSAIDQGHGWKHGYAMALTNASTTAMWAGASYQSTDETGDTYGSFTYNDYTGPYTSFSTNKDGYSETHAISNKPVYSQANYPTFWYALNYGVTAPNGSSGWYLPSIGQWWDVLINLVGVSASAITGSSAGWCRWCLGENGATTNYSTLFVTNMNKYLTAVSSVITPDYFSDPQWYWTSSEYGSNCPYRAYWGGGNLRLGNSDDNNKSATKFITRSVIAF